MNACRIVHCIVLTAGLSLAAAVSAHEWVSPVALGGAASLAMRVGPSRDSRDRQVRIHNQTGWTMKGLHLSRPRINAWDADLLSAEVLPSGGSWSVNLDDGSGACVFDLKAVFTNGRELVRPGVNVCEIADYYYTR